MRLLLNSTNFSIEDVVQQVDALGGLVIPAHVNRTAYGLFPTIGFLADWWNFPALEISRHITPEALHSQFPSSKNHSLIQSGDAHRLDEILGTTLFEMETPTMSEIRMALRSENQRKVWIESRQFA
jgi:PHP family Zn ribbon phosphoesterase